MTPRPVDNPKWNRRVARKIVTLGQKEPYLKRAFLMLTEMLVWKILGYKSYIRIYFRIFQGYFPDLRTPKTYQEKLQWIKLNGKLDRFAKYCDKYGVRKYVSDVVGEKYLVPIIGVYDHFDEIDFEKLPHSFVIKMTHGSGWNIRVPDKSRLDMERAKKNINKWLRSNYYYRHGEPNYLPLKGRIMIEEFLHDPDGDLKNYNIFCSQGVPMYISVDGGRYTYKTKDIFDVVWNKVPMMLQVHNFEQPVPKPERLQEMLEIATKLSKPIPFVRIDLYCTDNKIYFGEMTFTSGNGVSPIYPVKYSYLWADMIDLERYV